MDNCAVTIVGYGDSITLAGRQEEKDRWLVVLGRSLEQAFPDRAFTVINSGVGGQTSREGLRRMDRDVVVHKPDWVLVQFGGNDATRDEGRHVSFEEFGENLDAVLSGVKAGTSAQVLLLTFPPIIDDWHAWGHDPFYEEWGGADGCVEEYRKITRRFAGENGLPLADIDRALRAVEAREGQGTCTLTDGVHLTTRGNAVAAEEVFRVLKGEV